MNYRYDPESDALYVSITPGRIDRTEELEDGVVVDLDAAGALIGIDVMVPSHGWNPKAISDRFRLSETDVSFLERLARDGRFSPALQTEFVTETAKNVEVQQTPPRVPASA